MIIANRYHDFSCGHRVYGHESKCRHLHGHNYRVVFTLGGLLDTVGRVIDFGIIKTRLCDWLEEKWDHKMLIWESDPMRYALLEPNFEVLVGLSENDIAEVTKELYESTVLVPFNPTAENMAEYLLNVIGPQRLQGTSAKLVSVRVEETRKCSAEAFN
jgi:6-pyruvoyltetrahydropterin/6-carboxytetrahydropterin synthase